MKKKRFHLWEFMGTCGMIICADILFGICLYVIDGEFKLLEFCPLLIIPFVIGVIVIFTGGVLLLSGAYNISKEIYR